MDTIIRIRIRDVYGFPKAYPADVQAERLAQIAKTKTLTRRDLHAAEAMGFTIFVMNASPHDWHTVE